MFFGGRGIRLNDMNCNSSILKPTFNWIFEKKVANVLVNFVLKMFTQECCKLTQVQAVVMSLLLFQKYKILKMFDQPSKNMPKLFLMVVAK